MKYTTMVMISAFALACAMGCKEGNRTEYEDNDLDMFEESPEERLEKADTAAIRDSIRRKTALDTLQRQ